MNLGVSEESLAAADRLATSIDGLTKALNRWCDVREEELT